MQPLKRVAYFVCHGMGQQVPYETLSMLAQILLKGKTGAAQPSVVCRRVKLTLAADAPELSRVEVTTDDQYGSPVEAHIYEAYWAPLTEGQISFTAVVLFLYTAAWNGLKTCLRSAWRRGEMARALGLHPQRPTFNRWVFGDFYDFEIFRGTAAALGALVVIVTLLVTPVFLLGGSKLSVVWQHRTTIWPWFKRLCIVHPVLAGLLVLALALLLLLVLVVRYFFVEYIGDVAIYVSSYTVSRYDEIRKAIQAIATGVVQQIYAAGVADQSHDHYDEVVIVGHSLGSVLAYDTLNAAINWDEIDNGGQRHVVARTTRLITFGSPLDKTAFLFRTQVSSARAIREALAARQQPLVLDYVQYRRKHFRWINIHSAWDIISGTLCYYDLPENTPEWEKLKTAGSVFPASRVRNVRDPQAKIPLAAHVQYWNNDLLHVVLQDAL